MRLASRLSENKPVKLLSDNDRYSRDSSLLKLDVNLHLVGLMRGQEHVACSSHLNTEEADRKNNFH